MPEPVMSESSRFFEETNSEPKTVVIEEQTALPSSPTPSLPSIKQRLFVPNDDDEEEPGEDDGYSLFESMIQGIVPEICPAIVQKLYLQFKDYENPVAIAVNAYYDSDNAKAILPDALIIKKQPKQEKRFPPHNLTPSYGAGATPLSSQQKTSQTRVIPSSQTRLSSEIGSSPITRTKRPKIKAKFSDKILPSTIEWRRFIGSIQVVAWATRPTVKPVPYGTCLSVVKNNSTSDQPRKGRRGTMSSNVSSYVKLIQDNHIASARKEIGRLPEDIANILFPLLDQDICDFDITLVFCDGRLSIGDSFIVQLDCYLTSRAFKGEYKDDSFTNEVKQMKQSHTNFNSNVHETPEEQQERRRQAALVKLFNKLEFEVNTADDEQEMEVITIDDDDNGDYSRKMTPVEKEHVDEMNLNQLKEFYKRAQTEKILTSLPETETGSNFKLQLRSYQKQGLTWMLRSERELENSDELGLMNPLWKEFKWPKDRSWRASRDKNFTIELDDEDKKFFYANLYSGEFSSTRPVLKSLCRGGILADEMGLGKTISTLSLIHNAPCDKNFNREEALQRAYAYSTTLVVVPTSLLTQWQDEFTNANADGSSFLVYYGNDTQDDLRYVLCKENPHLVVFTTYGTIQNEWSKMINGSECGKEVIRRGLFSVKFFRVVLDEGHNIRNRMAKTTKACYDIQASRKWLLTGTPIINRLDDLYSLVKFLKLEPWSHISYWNTFVTSPFEKKHYKQALDVVQAILEPVLLRRTKNMKKDGKPLVELPPKEVVIERIKFSPKEWRLYSWFLQQAERSVTAGIRKGDLLKNFTSVLVHILRLRQLCDHMDLVRASGDEMDEDISSKTAAAVKLDIPHELLAKSETFSSDELIQSKALVQGRFKSLRDLECSICTTQPIPLENIVFTECGHAYCLSCILEHCDYQDLKATPTLCPNCRALISASKFLKPISNICSVENVDNLEKYESYHLQRFDNSMRSSKLNALLGHLRVIRDSTPNEKVVVFSQFSSYLDIMEKELEIENGLTVLKFHGGLSMEKRSEILKNFKRPRQGVTVLLLSLKAGGVGLNLTEASRAFMCDPWWSPSVEDQAIDRIHRIGQNNSVKVVRFIMEGSIEEKMLKIQERKRTIGEAVEAEEEERRKRRVEEIQMLFEHN